MKRSTVTTCATRVTASGALPPAFPAIRIDGEPYPDGGVYPNTPIEVILDELKTKERALPPPPPPPVKR